eukprot:757458-Hanusia_phi.AAC.5
MDRTQNLEVLHFLGDNQWRQNRVRKLKCRMPSWRISEKEVIYLAARSEGLLIRRSVSRGKSAPTTDGDGLRQPPSFRMNNFCLLEQVSHVAPADARALRREVRSYEGIPNLPTLRNSASS